MPRPTTLTAELSQEICDLLEKGNYLETAAQACDVSINTVYGWLRKGAQGIEPYAAFAQVVERARAKGEVGLVETVRGGDEAGVSFGRARAAAHLLAVTRPQRFATRINVKVREQLTEFTQFLEGQLADILAQAEREGRFAKGEEVFEEICDRWLNRQPMDIEPHGGEPNQHEAPPGGTTLQ